VGKQSQALVKDVAAIALEETDIGFKVGDKNESQALFDYLMAEHEDVGPVGETDSDNAQALYEKYAEEEGLDELSQAELRDDGKKLDLKLEGLSKKAMIDRIKKALEERNLGKAVSKEETAQFKGKEKIALTQTQLYKMLAIAENKA